MMKLILVLFCLGAILGFYMLLVEPFWTRVTYTKIQTDKWSYDQPLKVVAISDMHMTSPWMTRAHLQRIANKVSTLNPDVVFLLGDYKGDHEFGIDLDPFDAVKPFDTIKSNCGVYAVIGNHDLEEGGRWPDAMEQLNVPLLRNKTQKISCNGMDFWIAGLDDLWYGKPDLKATLDQVTDDNPILLLSHIPDIFPEVPQNVTATFSGHTHAGQIRFPFVGTIDSVVPSRFGGRYAYGHIHEEGKDLFVTAGLGNTGLPLRLLNRPEIAVVMIER